MAEEKLSMSTWVRNPDDVLVFLDDELQGMVIEADSEKGYVVKRALDGCLVTFKGKVRIEYAGKLAVRVELPAKS